MFIGVGTGVGPSQNVIGLTIGTEAAATESVLIGLRYGLENSTTHHSLLSSNFSDNYIQGTTKIPVVKVKQVLDLMPPDNLDDTSIQLHTSGTPFLRIENSMGIPRTTYVRSKVRRNGSADNLYISAGDSNPGSVISPAPGNFGGNLFLISGSGGNGSGGIVISGNPTDTYNPASSQIILAGNVSLMGQNIQTTSNAYTGNESFRNGTWSTHYSSSSSMIRIAISNASAFSIPAPNIICQFTFAAQAYDRVVYLTPAGSATGSAIISIIYNPTITSWTGTPGTESIEYTNETSFVSNTSISPTMTAATGQNKGRMDGTVLMRISGTVTNGGSFIIPAHTTIGVLIEPLSAGIVIGPGIFIWTFRTIKMGR